MPSDSLEISAGTLTIGFATPFYDDASSDGATAPDYTHALGYSYSEDPMFMYCAEDMTLESAEAINWWLGSCGLSGGASGGPWIQPMTGGTGPIISVNSRGYLSSPGMAGPRLDDTTAFDVMTIATCADFAVATLGDGYAGIAVDGTTTCP